MFTLAELESVLPTVHAVVPPTPQYAWPLLRARTGVEVVVKHENHTPIGAFKVRGGMTYFDRLKRERPHVNGVVTATRGNHGQSLAFAGARAGVPVALVVPHGNSVEKNAAMRAFGAELIEHGRDFDEAKERAKEIAAERGYEFGPSFHRDLVIGVATYALRIVQGRARPRHGLCADRARLRHLRPSSACAIARLRTRVVGVVAEGANCYRRFRWDAGHVVPTNAALTFADGMAVRVPDARALEIIRRGAERIVEALR